MRAEALSLGAFFSCAILEGNSMRCWGIVDYGLRRMAAWRT
ncbi:MAG: hypothetical protein IT384_26340 [Deltaproteobacteria bacterium]|nr:hypothetical protein [Deltaproteobacteria bacterium]